MLPAPNGSPAATRPVAATQPAGLRPFQPGVSIDWAAPAVHVDTVVSIRSGPLEFLAGPPEKQHESVLLLQARARDIVSALGLIGLNAGSPPRWDAAAGTWSAPTGDLLDISLAWDADGTRQTADAWSWLREFEYDRPPRKRPWVLAGGAPRAATPNPGARSGVGIALVAFPDSLICPLRVYSERNDELWALADPSRIPAEGTPVTLILRVAATLEPQVRIDAFGGLSIDGRDSDLADLLEVLTIVARQRPGHSVSIQLETALLADELRWRRMLSEQLPQELRARPNWRLAR